MGIVSKVAEYGCVDDWQYDPWGSCLMLHFAICDVLDSAGGYGNVLAGWDYHRGARSLPTLEDLAADTDDYHTADLASAYLAGELTAGELISAGNVLERYAGLLKRAGMDY